MSKKVCPHSPIPSFSHSLILSLILFLVCSCNKTDHPELTGYWEVKDYSLLEKGNAFIKGVRWFEAGTNLTLNTDSTFVEQHCGSIIKGKWSHIGDSVILNSDSIWFENAAWHREHVDPEYDSIAGNGSEIRTGYIVEDDNLVQLDKGNRSHSQDDATIKPVEGFSLCILRKSDTR